MELGIIILIFSCFELSILLLLRESHIATQIWNLECLSHIMVFVYIFAIYNSFESVCVYITIKSFAILI